MSDATHDPTDLRPPIPQFHCQCCNLPLCFAKSSGIGYWCPRCLAEHWTFDGQRGWESPVESAARNAQIPADHELMAAVWWALVDVESRGPLADAIREALPDGQADL